MSSMVKKTFDERELKWGAIKRYDGANEKTAQLTFCSYVIFFRDEDGVLRNVVNQDEIFDDIDRFLPFSLKNIRNMQVGKQYLERISETASFILYRAFDINKKKKYTINEIEDAILACDMLFFKDREKIESKREVAIQKVKKI